MRVHLIKRQTIEGYVKKNAQSREGFLVWLSAIKWVDWDDPKNIMNTFNYADILGNGVERVVFNIGGNKYRMICKYHFGKVKVHLFICWIGTHAEYDKLCKKEEQYTVSIY